MEFIDGTPMGKLDTALTADPKSQLETILHQLDDLRIYHEKEHVHCLIESSGKVRFIDFNL